MWHNGWTDGWMMHNWGMGMWVVIAIALALMALTIRLVNGGRSSRHADSALEILERRYAEGEIDEPEFERRRDELLGV